MTHQDAGHYATKHPSGTKPNQKLIKAIKQKSTDEKVSCVALHKIATNLNFSPSEAGVVTDLLEYRLNKCQLGLFGYSPQKAIVKPAINIPADIKNLIDNKLENNRISCIACWEIAQTLKIPKMDVSSVCEALKIKITKCQLGAF